MRFGSIYSPTAEILSVLTFRVNIVGATDILFVFWSPTRVLVHAVVLF